jgi:endonuclease/exonuclease/phosphatase family metal-dependent hydrolase
VAAILVRSWNVFHGRTDPPGRQAHLEETVELASRDGPDVLCLQELPLWALPRLEQWSRMAAYGERTRGGLGRAGRRLTSLHDGLFRSAFTGQANAVLVGPRLKVLAHARLVFNGRLSQWAIEPRVSQAVRLERLDGATLVVVNLHLSHFGDGKPAEAELRRTAAFANELAAPREPVVLAGDLNLSAESVAVRELVEAGFSAPGPGIDHVLVRGAPVSPLVVWPLEKRTFDGRLLSDHPPVELEVG